MQFFIRIFGIVIPVFTIVGCDWLKPYQPQQQSSLPPIDTHAVQTVFPDTSESDIFPKQAFPVEKFFSRFSLSNLPTDSEKIRKGLPLDPKTFAKYIGHFKLKDFHSDIPNRIDWENQVTYYYGEKLLQTPQFVVLTIGWLDNQSSMNGTMIACFQTNGTLIDIQPVDFDFALNKGRFTYWWIETFTLNAQLKGNLYRMYSQYTTKIENKRTEIDSVYQEKRDTLMIQILPNGKIIIQ